MNVLSLSCVYPSPLQPTFGTFVRARLARVARRVPLKVLAPVAVMEYGNAARGGPASAPVPFRCVEDGIEVLRPRWIYPPLGGAANAAFLAARLLPVVRRLRRDFPFSVLDAHFAYPDGIAAALLARSFDVPYTITLRGNEPMHGAYPVRGMSIRWAIRNAASIIAVSGRLAQFAEACGAPPNRIRVIPNGVDTSLFHPRPATRVYREMGIQPGTPVIVSAGYLIERKGHHHVIRALARLRSRGSQARLVIAGGPGSEGDYRTVLHSVVKDLRLEDRVYFTGAVPPATLASYFSEASVVCLASSREGWPNVVNEALACGAPVIATDIGGVPDMLPSTDYGIVIPRADEHTLASALDAALARDWDRKRIASWGMSRTWEKVAEEVQETLALASSHRRSN